MKIFQFDNDMLEKISRITDYAILNILSLIFSLPLITVGTAVSAKYYVAMKFHRREEPTVLKPFLKAFKENLPTGTVLSVLCEIIGLSFLMSWLMIRSSEKGSVPLPVMISFTIISILFLMICFCIFPFFARYDLRVIEIIKSVAFFAMANAGWILIGLLLEVVTYWFCYQNIRWCWLIWLISKSFTLYVFSGFFNKKFDLLEKAKKIVEGE